MSEKLYKVTGYKAEAHHGGNGAWNKPKGKRPGKWMPPIKGDLIPCENGYHLCREQDLVYWLGPVIWEADTKGERLDGGDKIVVRQARLLCKLDTWNDRAARLFACDCAEKALELIEKPDQRSIEAVRVARLYAIGEATDDELAAARDAAWYAARAAARDAAWYAARAAAWEWQTKRLFEYLRGAR